MSKSLDISQVRVFVKGVECKPAPAEDFIIEGAPMTDEEWRIIAEATAPRWATTVTLQDGRTMTLKPSGDA